MKHRHREEKDCLNCGAEVSGNFCSNCGQENLNLHESFWHFLGHSVGHYFHFDSKFFNTLKPLITKPGFLTVAYIEGKRTQFLQPVSMFIFISIVYFLVTPLLKNKKNDEFFTLDAKKKEGAYIPFEYEKAFDSLPKFTEPLITKTLEKADLINFSKLSKQRQSEAIDSLKKISNNNRNNKELKSYLEKINRIYISKLKIDTYEPENDELSSSDVMRKYGSKVFFLLTPIFAFFLMRTFRKNGKLYLEHIIYTLHFQSFAFIVLLISDHLVFLLPSIIGSLIKIVVFGVLVWYIFKSLKLVYKRSGRETLWKMFRLAIYYSIAFGLSTLIVQTIVNYIPH
ncbi:hypothetical protein A5893_03150 [Pedobacter psychrophilus]|uniref:DUF3667 domain-containing protein n=1 Tax=Pedobacter psychrophilus TaxID=1826909 RepID=A0A179DM51_9SPHI|nr:DUF3667 domain-containing protein [Pedobacter psychrophilus]OAQ42126.1 hypothetical protein A5893_03150 [Pedobacter psychrophilus]